MPSEADSCCCTPGTRSQAVRCGGQAWRVTHTLVTPCDLQATAAQLRVALPCFRPLHLQRSTHLTVPASVPAIQARLGTWSSCAPQQAAIQRSRLRSAYAVHRLAARYRLRFHPPLFHLFALRSSIWRQRAFSKRVTPGLAQSSCSDEQREDADIGHRPSWLLTAACHATWLIDWLVGPDHGNPSPQSESNRTSPLAKELLERFIRRLGPKLLEMH